jgi:hypothetical protein
VKNQRSNAFIRVRYRFSHELEAAQKCTTVFHQMEGLAAAGAEVNVTGRGMKIAHL